MPFPRKMPVQGSGRDTWLSPLLGRAGTGAVGTSSPKRSAGRHPSQQPCFPGTDAFRLTRFQPVSLEGKSKSLGAMWSVTA